MTESQASILKRITIGVIIFALLILLYRIFVHSPLSSSGGIVKKNEKLHEQIEKLEEEIDELNEERDLLVSSIDDIELANYSDESEEDFDHYHWTEQEDHSISEETSKRLKEEIESAKKDPLLVSTLPVDDQVRYVYARMKGNGSKRPSLDAGDVYALQQNEKAIGPHLLIQRSDKEYRPNVYLTGPWAFVVHKNRAGIYGKASIVPVDERFQFSTDETEYDFGSVIFKGGEKD